MFEFLKAGPDPELVRLDALLAKQERAIQQAFADYVASAKSPEVTTQIVARLEAGDVEGALKILDSYIARMGAVVPSVINSSAAAEVAATTAIFEAIAPAIGYVFDPTDRRAADLAAQAKLEFIRGFTDSQRAAVRQALIDAFTEGAGPRDTARAFRNAIGLTPDQEEAVRNYRRLVESGTRESLTRDLRDRRYDPTIDRARRTGKPIPPATVDRMVERYRQRFLAYRSEVIARTEGVRLNSLGREEGFRQNLAAAGLSEDDAEKAWRTTEDGRERATHHAMNGQVRPFYQPFDSPSGAKLRFPGDPTAPLDETAQCRCHSSYSIKGFKLAAAGR